MATKKIGAGPGETLAAGAALRHVQQLGIEGSDVAKLTVDGAEVNVADATAAVDAATSRPAHESTGLVNRVLDKFEKTADAAKPILAKTAAGRAVLKVLNDDPENVTRQGVVALTLKNGQTLEVPVTITDTTATKWLQRTSMMTELVGIPVSLIPFMPNVASGGLAIAAGLASLFADAIGRRDLGGALRATAAKHVALAVTSVVPGLGEVVAAYSLILDKSNLRRLHDPARVEDIVMLSAHAPA